LVDIDAISESAGRGKPPDRGSPSRRRTPSVVGGTSRSLATRSRRSHLFAVTRHEEIPEACRNQYVELLMSSWHRRADASVDDTGRGPLWGPRLRFSIWLFLGEDPISGFGQVAGYRPDGRLVPAAAGNARIELAHVPVRRARPVAADDVGGFHEGPLEVAVDVGPERAIARPAAAGVDARRGAGIGGQLGTARKAADVAELEENHHAEDEANAGKAPEQFELGGGGEEFAHALFKLRHLSVQRLDLLQHALGGIGGLGRQLAQVLLQPAGALTAEEVAHVRPAHAILGQGGVDAVLEPGALADEDHSRPRQVALVAQCAGGDPDGGQGPRPLKPVEAA